MESKAAFLERVGQASSKEKVQAAWERYIAAHKALMDYEWIEAPKHRALKDADRLAWSEYDKARNLLLFPPDPRD